MKINHKNYVPILRWKRAEQSALFELDKKEKNKIFPLIELVMPKPKSDFKSKDINDIYKEVIRIFLDKKIAKIPLNISSVWDKRPIFLDTSLLYSEIKIKATRYILNQSQTLGLKIIPVFNLVNLDVEKNIILEAHNKHNLDICIRISTEDLEDLEKLNNTLKKYLKLENFNEESTYLLVDFKELTDTSKYMNFVSISQNIINLKKWKGFILSNGSFPLDLRDCKRDEDNFQPRLEWLNWKKIYSEKKLNRIPTFSDYGIRFPIYNESFQFFMPTASIKYTFQDSWYIIKGKKGKFGHFLSAAKLIHENDEIYSGKKFSSGDRYIAEKAEHHDDYMRNPKIKGTGTTESWLKAGLNHHLCIVSDQLSNLT